ncbi:hypothetical protein B0T10DRAFT_511329 [Thelonectria olida]|uniref:Uncharacterized protein n=1 Tax=Thelonectria olida TaxID=1576542 RepID=A0A9P9AP11_9HYPO|nr:hypothetical protein B0T10DRAFT_511329 [Thelonectria olida]
MELRFLAVAITWALWQTGASALAASDPKYLITFGDSFTRTRFNVTRGRPTPANPMGNPAFPGVSTSGGMNWVSSLAAELNTSLTLSYNFAQGGATVDARIVPPHSGRVNCLADQVGQFLKSIATRPEIAPWTRSNALVGVWIGLNDVSINCERTNSTAIYPKSIARCFELLQLLYYVGIRKFVLLTAPPVEFTPMRLAKDPEINAIFYSHLKLYRKLFAAAFRSFQATNPDMIAAMVDTYESFSQTIEDPAKYGATNATCWDEDGLSCLWWNHYHPGIAIHRLVAEEVGKVVNSPKYAW